MNVSKRGVFLKVFSVWFIIMLAEVVHGALRMLFLAPWVGDFMARQLAVFTGSAIILAIAAWFIRWIGAVKTGTLLGVGLLWVGLTLLFEFVLGMLVLGYSWERMLSDYKLTEGGLMPIGLLAMALSPLIAAKVRGVK